MSEQNTTQTELVEKTNDCEIKPTAMELILERALENDVDIDHLKRLLELREQEITRQERQNFVRDLSAMQLEYKNIEQNAINIHTKSLYTTLDKYIDAIKGPLATHHFALFSRIKEQSSNSITVEMTLKHISGNEISTDGNTLLSGISLKQMNEIKELIKKTQSEESKLISFVGAKNLTDMSYKQAQIALFALKKKQRLQMNKAQQSLPPQEQQTAV